MRILRSLLLALAVLLPWAAPALLALPTTASAATYNPNLIDSDTDDYIARQKANGGSGCTAATKFYVNQFILKLKDTGVWPNISRCNILAGPDIQSAMTPLKVGTSANAIETYNFVSGDYSQATGLQGNGTTKYMRTGLTPANAGITAGSGHLIAYMNTQSVGSGARVMVGVQSGPNTHFSQLYADSSSGNLGGRIGDNSGNSTVTILNRLGFLSINAQSSLMDFTYNSKSLLNTPVSTSGSLTALEYYVMARNENGTSAGLYNDGRMCFYSIGLGLTRQQLVDYRFAVQRLEANLGRNITLLNPIICWGDSLTAGSGGTPYPTDFATQYPLFYVNNSGLGGDTSTQMLTRWQNDPAFRELPTIIWIGRNDILTTGKATILANIATIVSALEAIGNTKYLVLSVPNRDDEQITSSHYISVLDLNADLATAYSPNHYYDIRSYLITQYNQNNATDVANHTDDIPPSSLRFDTVHYNSAGYLVIANKLRQVTASLGWWP